MPFDLAPAAELSDNEAVKFVDNTLPPILVSLKTGAVLPAILIYKFLSTVAPFISVPLTGNNTASYPCELSFSKDSVNKVVWTDITPLLATLKSSVVYELWVWNVTTPSGSVYAIVPTVVLWAEYSSTSNTKESITGGVFAKYACSKKSTTLLVP